MRRGFSLIEMVGVLPILIAVMVVFSAVFYASLDDVPKLQQVAHTNSVLSHMMARLTQDVDAAESLPESAFGQTANERMLLLKIDGGTVAYKIQDDEIVREELASGRNKQEKRDYRWRVPEAKVSFHRWVSSGSAYAVEVRRAVQYHKQDQTEEKLVNRHVLYPSSIAGYREKQ